MAVETSHRTWSESDQQAVRAQLARILQSGALKQSKRRQRFLTFLVDETLAGREEQLKGYTIAVAVFDRPTSFDPLVDPVVRIEAGRLRDKLHQYYSDSGAGDAIFIDLPKGGYIPSIDFRKAAVGQPASEPADAVATDLPPEHAETEADANGDSSIPPPRRPRSGNRWLVGGAAMALAVVLMLGGVGPWQTQRQRELPQTASQKAMRGAPTGPVIAVLPFANLGEDPDQKYFSYGLTDDILVALSRAPDLFVLARDLTFRFERNRQDVAQFGRELKADYALEGSVRRSGERLRVTVHLIDTRTGHHIWAERFDRAMSDILLVQDEIVSEIVSKLLSGYGAIGVAEGRTATRKSPDEIQAYDLILQAQDVLLPEWSRASFTKARTLLDRAMSLDPNNARAHRELAFLAIMGWIFHLNEHPVPPQEFTKLAIRATKLDPDDARAHMVAAAAYFWTKQPDLFEHESGQALTRAPYDAEILAIVGCMIAKSGEWQRGVTMLEKAYALNAAAAGGWYEATLALHAYLNSDYERALAMIRQAPDQNTFYAYLEYIPIYGQLGRRDEARALWNKLRAEEPDASAETFANWFRLWSMPETDIAKLMEGVKKSGVVEASP